MRIYLNSRNLNAFQQGRIEQYFQKKFVGDGNKPALIWKEYDSSSILLGYPLGHLHESERDDCEESQIARELLSIRIRVHENELKAIAGRTRWQVARKMFESLNGPLQSSGC
jgi:hypothetical protein